MNKSQSISTNKISVIIPTYNRGDILSKSIDSVLNQTHKDLEVIVVDDFSTDHTESVIKSYQDPRLKYIKLPQNRGACYARNLGIKKSTGQYIAFQDSDDIFYPNKLAKQLTNLTAQKSDLDFCKVRINVHNFKSIVPNRQQAASLKKSKITDLLCAGNFISTQSILAKRTVFDDLTFNPDLPRFQDYDLVLRISQKYRISHTPEILVNLYRQNDSISKSQTKLIDACSIMLNTDYGLNAKQIQALTKTLLHQVESSVKEKDAEAYYELSCKYDGLKGEFDLLLAENQKLNHDLYEVLNSRSWKAAQKLQKLTRPFK